MRIKAIVTGSKGFIGSHLVSRLEQEGFRVKTLDLPQDIRKKKIWEKALKDIDYVFHIAGHLDNFGKPDFAQTLDTNAKSVALMFEVILEKKLKIKKIIVASSQSVYGEGLYRNGKPLREKETDPLNPISAYGASKVAMESMLFSLGKLYKIPVVALRYSIVLGAGQKFKDMNSGALRGFVAMGQKGQTIITHEDGNQLRDFINIHDVVEAHITVLDKKADYQAFNVGAGKSVKVIELARLVAERYGVKTKAGGKKRFSTARHSLMNIDKLKSLGWSPKNTLEDSIDEYISWVTKRPFANE